MAAEYISNRIHLAERLDLTVSTGYTVQYLIELRLTHYIPVKSVH